MRVGKLHLSLYTFLCACFISVIYHFKVWTINIHLTVLSAKNKKREGINYWNKIISLLHQTQTQLHLSWTELALFSYSNGGGSLEWGDARFTIVG